MPAAHSTETDHMGRAMVWMVLSGLSFALMGAAVKYAGDIGLPVKVFFRNLVTLAITTGVAVRVGQNPFARTPHAGLLIARSLSGLCGVFLYFLALGHLNLADASLLNKTSPFFVAVFAVLVLHEPFDRRMLPVLIVAFIGAALVIKPGFMMPRFDGAHLPALAGLASGAFAGLAYVLVRSMKGRESPNRIIFTFSLVSCLATAPFLMVDPPSPSGVQWAALLATGAFAAGGQFGLTFAYHHARASRISVFTYLHVLFAVGVGFVLFDERPDLLTVLGGALIIGAAWRTHRLGRETRGIR